jgi:TnpA family transposase
MLKSFQRLGYFVLPEEVPPPFIVYLKKCLQFKDYLKPVISERTQRYYQEAIRSYLGVKPYSKQAQKIAAIAVARSAKVREYSADLINVAIEELVKERYELPAFSTLDRLIGHIKFRVNQRLYLKITASLSQSETLMLEQLVSPEAEANTLTLNLLKSLPKKANLAQIKALQNKFNQLMSFGDTKRLLADVPATKIKAWAAMAKASDIGELRDTNPAKRQVLLLCLLYQAQVKTRDHLVEMFLKRIKKIDNQAQQRLVELRDKHLAQTESLLEIFTEVLQVSTEVVDERNLGQQVQSLFNDHGGAEQLLQQCAEITAYNSKNHLPLLWHFYSRYRKVLFELINSLEIVSSNSDQSLIEALNYVLKHEHKRKKYLPATIDLSFLSEAWRKLVIVRCENQEVLVRQQLEICIFTYLATELKTGDACVVGSENYADFREQLLPWSECETMLPQYCEEMGFPDNPEQFIEHLRSKLTEVALKVDQICKKGDQVMIGKDGIPILKRIMAQSLPEGAESLETAILAKMPERNLLDILTHVEHWLNWTRHFGPISGNEPKLADASERYLLTVFGYGCNLGPNQMARHAKGLVSSHALSYTNRRHITSGKLEAAIRDLINAYNRLNLPKCWGTGKRAAADGSKFEVYENNLLSEYHIRYGGYGGIAYHHVSDTYIALFTHFISCGVWEAVYILDGLLKNTSDIQPDILHADTQGQSTPVFGLSYLLGIELMPRIRNWQDQTFFRPDKDAKYEYLDPLFKGVVDWKLIETHWQDLMQMVLSIKAGKLMPSTILRKLGSYSRKNRVYQAFKELGQVIRTLFLLQYISDRGMRQEITACTNKVEGYNHFLDWLFFGKDGIITENDPEEQEKRLKYLDLIASAVILQNTIDLSLVIQQLSAEGYRIKQSHLATLSPYLTSHIKRYGDYVVDWHNLPQPWEQAIPLPLEIFET